MRRIAGIFGFVAIICLIIFAFAGVAYVLMLLVGWMSTHVWWKDLLGVLVLSLVGWLLFSALAEVGQ